MSKICPLLFASAADVEVECRPDCCAWAYEGGCAVLAIAQSLDSLNDHGIVAWVEKENDND